MNEPQEQASDFPLSEMREFLETFLHGLLTEGLTQPLQKYAEGRDGVVAEGARGWRARLMAGAGPIPALKESHGFPSPINELLIEGMDVGAIDYVVKDMMRLLEDCSSQTARSRLSRLLDEYRARPKRTSLCAGCVQRDIERMFQRAEVERAVEVRLGMSGGFMEQRFAGPYVVTFRQPTRPEVHAALLQMLKQGGEIAGGISCSTGNQPNHFILEKQAKTLLVTVDS